MITKLKFPLLFLLAALMTITANADDYQKGHEALEIFDDEGMENTPQWVMTWIMFMAASFAASLLFVWRHSIARWVAGCFVAGILALILSDTLFGVTQLSGFIALMHILFWSPALYQLLSKRPFMNKPITPFSLWSGLITAVILFSFVFDIRDAAIYLHHLLF